MNTARADVFAKINLTLDLLGKEGEYHLIDSLVLSVDLFDRIVARRRKDGKITVSMHGMGSEAIPPEKNTAYLAGERFTAEFQTTGADITVYKNIPIGAGLGGSSADAAGVLNALGRLYGTDAERTEKLAPELGSDVGFLLKGGFARMRGRGEQLVFFESVPLLYLLLLVPKKGVSTRECYALSDRFPPEKPRTDRVLEALSAHTEWAAKVMGNGLTAAASALVPEVGKALSQLKAFSPWGVNMTGSGSGVYAVFETRELCEWAKSRYRGDCAAYVLRTGFSRSGEGRVSLGEEG